MPAQVKTQTCRDPVRPRLSLSASHGGPGQPDRAEGGVAVALDGPVEDQLRVAEGLLRFLPRVVAVSVAPDPIS